MSLYALTWLVVVLPFAFSLLSYLSEVPRRAALVAMLGTAAALVLSLVVLADRGLHSGQNPYQSLITFWTYPAGQQPQGTIGDFHPQAGVLVDGLSAAVMPVVALVSLLIQIYSTAYMRNDRGYHRFFVLIGLFTFSMEGLVASPNLFQTYLMWEGVGVCSYLLIGHWWERPAAAAAATKAFLVTRIGDLAFLLAIVINFARLAPDIEGLPRVSGQDVNDPFNFQLLGLEWGRVASHQVLGVGSKTVVVVAVLVLVGALAKSAQIPFHVWLPDAMEGPTPISALIHAATMVAAGVYLVARTYPLFEAAPHVLTAVAILGAATAVLGAVCALAQRDIKRIIAYSTISHLGLMFTGLGVGAFSAAIFHLVTHAWFKALLFLVAGNLIVAYRTQDVFEMGAAWRRMRATSLALLLGCCSAAGVFLFAGFWSKDSIAAGVLRNQLPGGGHISHTAQGLLLVSVAAVSVLGAVYPFRLFFLVAFGEPPRRRGFQPDRVREAVPAMLWPVLLLAGLASVGGVVGIEGLRLSFSRLVYTGSAPQEIGLGLGGPLLGGGLSLAGVAVAWLVWGRREPLAVGLVGRLGRLAGLAAAGFRVDAAWAWAAARVVDLARLPIAVDGRVTDVAAESAVESASMLGGVGRWLQPGRIQTHAAGALAGVLVVAGTITLAATGHLPGVGGAH